MIEIPLNVNPEQQFSIEIDGAIYDCIVKLNSRTKQWSIGFDLNGEPVVKGVILVGGTNVVEQFPIPIKNMWVVDTDDDNNDPSVDNLGTVAKVFILEDEEVPTGA